MADEIEKLKEMQKILIEQVEQYNKTLQDVKMLRTDPKVKEYITKSKVLKQLRPKIDDSKLKIREEEMRHCNHIWITSEIISEWDGHRTDKSELRTCIKCGLDSHAVYTVVNRSEYASDMDWCMCHILNWLYYSSRGINTDIICSSKLAIAIYKKIIKEHPDITDEEVVFYLRQTLDEIRTIRVSDEVRKKRAKRLGLPQDFNKWDKSDVIN